MPPGRPSFKVEVDFNHPLDYLDNIKYLCKSEKMKANIILFATALLGLPELEYEPGQIMNIIHERTPAERFIDSVFNVSQKMVNYEKSFFISKLWTTIGETDKTKMLFMFYGGLSFKGQCDLFNFLGYSLNEDIYKLSTENNKYAKYLSIDDLKNSSKSELYNNCDGRLKFFIDALTERKKSKLNQSTNDNLNFKSNAYENILKARNSKFLCTLGMKEHMVVYLSSGKSHHASQVFSKQGGKGNQNSLEQILKNSENVCKLISPEKSTLCFTYFLLQYVQ